MTGSDGSGLSSGQALDGVVSIISRVGGLIGTTVRVTLAEGGPPLSGTLSAFRLAQDGGAGGIYVTLRERAGELRIATVEPARELDARARITGGGASGALPPTRRNEQT